MAEESVLGSFALTGTGKGMPNPWILNLGFLTCLISPETTGMGCRATGIPTATCLHGNLRRFLESVVAERLSTRCHNYGYVSKTTQQTPERWFTTEAQSAQSEILFFRVFSQVSG